MCRRLAFVTVALSCALSACLLTDPNPAEQTFTHPDSTGFQPREWTGFYLPIHDKPMEVAISPDSRTISVLTSKELTAWDLDTGEQLFTTSLPYRSEGVSYQKDNQAIVVRSGNKDFVYSSQDGTLICVEIVESMPFERSISDEITIHAYNSEMQVALASKPSQQYCYHIDPARQEHYPLLILDVRNDGPIEIDHTINACEPRLVFTSDGSQFAHFALKSGNNRLTVWDTMSLETVFTTYAGNAHWFSGATTDPVLSDDGKSVFLISHVTPEEPHNLSLLGWQTDSWTVRDSISLPHGVDRFRFSVSPDGKRTAFWRASDMLILDFPSGRLLDAIHCDGNWTESAEISPDGQTLVQVIGIWAYDPEGFQQLVSDSGYVRVLHLPE
jgi:hypothetical protein